MRFTHFLCILLIIRIDKLRYLTIVVTMGFCKKNYIFLEIAAIFTEKSPISKKEEVKTGKLIKIMTV